MRAFWMLQLARELDEELRAAMLAYAPSLRCQLEGPSHFLVMLSHGQWLRHELAHREPDTCLAALWG